VTDYPVPSGGLERIFTTSTDRPWFIKNTGTVPVILSISGIFDYTAFTLNPSDTKVWEAGQELYAYLPQGVTTTGKLNVTENAGNYYSVTDLASALTGGTLLTPDAIALSIYNQTVPNSLSASQVINQVSGAAVTSASTDFDVGLSSFIEFYAAYSPSAAAATTELVTMEIDWFLDAAHTQPVAYDQFNCLLHTQDLGVANYGQSGRLGLKTKARYGTMRLASTAGSTFNYWVWAFASNLNVEQYAFRFNTGSTGGLSCASSLLFPYIDTQPNVILPNVAYYPDPLVIAGSVPIGTSDNIYFSHGIGRHVLNMYVTTAVGAASALTSVRVSVIRVATGSRLVTGVLFGNSAASQNIPVPLEVYLPNEPVRLFVENNTGVAVNLRASLTSVNSL